MAMSGSVRFPPAGRPIALPEAVLVGDRSRAIVGDLEGDADVSPYRVSASIRAGGVRRAGRPMLQHAAMNEAVFCVMIRT